MSSGKMTPSEEERMSSGSLDSEPLRRILSVSIFILFMVGVLGRGTSGFNAGLHRLAPLANAVSGLLEG
jgi:hypothetical protein